MSTPKHAPHPERLVEGQLARLLKEANREFAGELDQPAAFLRVNERLSTTHRRWPRPSYWLVPATLLVLAGVVALPEVSAVFDRARSDAGPFLAAEDLRGFRPKPAPLLSAETTAPPPVEHAETGHAEVRSTPSARPNPQRPSTAALGSGNGRALPPSATEPLEPQPSPVPDRGIADAPTGVVDAPTGVADAPTGVPESAGIAAQPDCLSLARRGQTRDAETCFLKRAEGSGLGAEMALYEVARLRRDVLADAAGALAALAEYRLRFPAGSLRREADMSQLELLLQLGRSDEALKQSDALLASSSSGERAAELRLLRGHILRKAQSRFADALHEYELAERAGMRGGEITYFRALCLDGLGRDAEAAALFAQYLEQPQRAYSADARRRLKRLQP